MNCNPIIYFYTLPAGPPKDAKYQHFLVCLAEGLKSLGIQYYARCDYWLNSTSQYDYLFRYNKGIVAEDCDIIIIDSSFISECGIPKEIKNRRRNFIAVLIEGEDGVRTPSHSSRLCKYFDLILRSHYNREDIYKSDRVKPWAFGLSNRMLQELGSVSKWSEREQSILVSFGCMHPLRRQVIKNVIPNLREVFKEDKSVDMIVSSNDYHSLMWRQTGRRHYPEYYERLKSIRACAAFGGLTPPAWEVESNIIRRYWRRRKEGYKTRLLTQWDSWRLWESLTSGAVTFHVDFEKYNLLLPVMPENRTHYIGIDMRNIELTIEWLKDHFDVLENISTAGREWAIENYSPVAVAKRLLAMVDIS